MKPSRNATPAQDYKKAATAACPHAGAISRFRATLAHLPQGDAQAIHALVTRQDMAVMRALPDDARMEVLARLVGPDKPEAKRPDVTSMQLRNFAAAITLATQAYPAGYEAFENNWASAMARTRLAASLRERRLLDWTTRKMGEDEILSFVADFADMQAAAFNRVARGKWAIAPQLVTTFCAPRAAFSDVAANAYPTAVCFYNRPKADDIRRYQNLRDSTERMIAVNIHADTGGHTGQSLVDTAAHEQQHMVVMHGIALHMQGKLHRADIPFGAAMESIAVQSPHYRFIMQNFSYAVYRCLMVERMAYSLARKVTDTLSGEAPKAEAEYLLQDIKAHHSQWIKQYGARPA